MNLGHYPIFDGKPPGTVIGETVPLPDIKPGEAPQQYVDRIGDILQPGQGGFFTPEQQAAFDAAGGDPVGDAHWTEYMKTATALKQPEPSILDTVGSWWGSLW